jgi:hypothetical protein
VKIFELQQQNNLLEKQLAEGKELILSLETKLNEQKDYIRSSERSIGNSLFSS